MSKVDLLKILKENKTSLRALLKEALKRQSSKS